MKVEVLYVLECPSHPAAVELVSEVLASQGIAADIQEILVADERMAQELRFVGSPTIRINGRDVAGDPLDGPAFGVSCRLYPGSKQIGLPPAETVRRAVLKARSGGHR